MALTLEITNNQFVYSSNCGHSSDEMQNNPLSNDNLLHQRNRKDMFKNNYHTQIMLSNLFKLFKNGNNFDKLSRYYFPSCGVHYCILRKKEDFRYWV